MLWEKLVFAVQLWLGVLAWVLIVAFLGGCSDAAYWNQRTFYGIDCRPEKLLPNGQCAPVKAQATVTFHRKGTQGKYCSRNCYYASEVKTSDDFWTHVDFSPHPQGCWLWTGALRQRKYNYGEFQDVLAHRYAYQLYHPDAVLTPDDLICHSCDNCPCVRDTHLWKGTNTDNIHDALGKGHIRRGTTSHLAKLTEEIVRAILLDYGKGNVTQRTLCQKYGIPKANMSCIIRRETWKHVTLDGEL